MTKLLLMAGAAVLISAAPAVAKPGHGGSHGNAHAKAGHAMNSHHMGHAAMRNAKATKGKTYARGRDRDRDGILDSDEALARKYGGALCPPGLYKKTPSCTPPGQAKRLFRDGQRIPTSYRYYTPYGDIPVALRDRYNLTDQYRYIYRNNVIYQVDPATQLVTNILNAVL
jgi:hypothetical protein